MVNEELPALHKTPEAAVEPRAGDSDREAVAEQLRVAAGDGRIDLGELEERLDRTYAARTYGELDILVADLGGRVEARDASAAEEVLTLRPRMNNMVQSGRWSVPRRIVAETKISLLTVDFTEAVCPHQEITVEASTGMGHIRLIVPRGWGVRIDPSSTNTGNIVNKAAEQAEPGAPVLTVIGHPRSGPIRIKQRRRG
ncbi:DUF1707 domain-containing protein [Kitasatospora sp. NPDC091257]|uniref:DUF1707 SHOCT-like domain-containing protein n=1 Tax=Kitasatospora sp. NPDC091257 TaxID=3364084 RepID=UPI00381B13F5